MLDQSAPLPLPETGSRGPDQCKGRRNTSLQMVEMIFFRGGCPSSVLRPRCRCYARIYQSSQSHSGLYKGRNEPFLPYCRRQSRNDFVPEGDVYRLVAHSRLPSVERFERRGFGDVLPSIRKTGMYALLAIYVDKVAKLIEQTGMKNTPSVLSDSAQRRTSPVQWQR